MSEFSKNEEPQEEVKQELEQPQAEMPEDFVETEGKSGRWGNPVKGEVEVEGKKVEVSFREKVIELPKHRQEETGIKRIRRRELLPPFPEGLYMPSLNERSPEIRQYLFERYEEGDKYFPVYSADEKFDSVYKFSTDGEYLADDTGAHVMDYQIAYEPIDVGSSDFKNVEQFKKEGLYFQELYTEEERDLHQIDPFLYLWGGRLLNDEFTTPVFIFGNKNKMFVDYVKNVIGNSEIIFPSRKGQQIKVPIVKKSGARPLRWCHAECALVPTKRSLNVLFFETGDEEKGEKEK